MSQTQTLPAPPPAPTDWDNALPKRRYGISSIQALNENLTSSFHLRLRAWLTHSMQVMYPTASTDRIQEYVTLTSEEINNGTISCTSASAALNACRAKYEDRPGR